MISRNGRAVGLIPAVSDLDDLVGALADAVFERVLAKIPYDLAQLARIDANFDLRVLRRW